MSVTISSSVVISGGSVSISSLPVIRTGSGPIGLSEDLAAAKTGSLTTRTDNTDGELTMAAGHGITTAAVIDLYWTGGNRYGVVVGTVATNAVPISGGSGDNLPTAATAITAVVQKAINILIDGDETKIIGMALETIDKTLRTAGHVQFRDASNAEIAAIDLVANVPQIWDIEGGSANPFTGNLITNLRASQGGSAAGESYILKIVGVQDASP
jgi:hypothetical protein